VRDIQSFGFLSNVESQQSAFFVVLKFCQGFTLPVIRAPVELHPSMMTHHQEAAYAASTDMVQ
jgi:hypothetical protein